MSESGRVPYPEPTVPVFVALPRAVNLGSHKKVAMADLKKLATDLGYEDAKTLLNSGNLLFRGSGSAAAVEKKLETEAKKRLGLDTEFMVRTASEWDKIVAANPFPKEAKSDPGHLVVLVCKKAGKPKVSGAKREVVKPEGREIYVTYPDGIGTSKLKIDVVGTARNWNTVLKIQAAAKG